MLHISGVLCLSQPVMNLILALTATAAAALAADPCANCPFPKVGTYADTKNVCTNMVNSTVPNRIVMTRYAIADVGCFLAVSGCQTYYKIVGNSCLSGAYTMDTLRCAGGSFGASIMGCRQ